MHERAFVDTPGVLEALADRLGKAFRPLVVTEAALAVDEAVSTYLFNSQLLHTAEGYVLICPAQVAAHASTAALVQQWQAQGDLARVEMLDLQESMRNGGGPACLRLRVPLSADELKQVHPGFRIDGPTLDRLEAWVDRWYPRALDPADLADPTLLETSREALDALTSMQDMGNLYPFQH